MKKAGTWWFWYYKDALKTNENVPEFKVEGRKSLLGYLFGTRQQLTNETLKSNTTTTNQQQKAYCFIFFPKADHSTDQFTSSLIQNFKTSVTLSKNQKNIHLFITCNNIEQFDNLTKNIPSGINIWADINGEIATKFGMRPLLLEVNLQSLFSNNNNNKNKYSKQTINGMFFILQNKIIKSPAYQPKLQTISIDTMKSIYDSIEKPNFNFEKIISKDAYAADLTESEIQNLYPNAWKEYEMEMNQMNKDLNNNVNNNLNNNKNITNKVKKSVVTKNSGVAALPLTTTTIKKKTNTTPTTTVKKKVTKTGGTNATNKALSSKKKISSNNNTKINKQRYSKL